MQSNENKVLWSSPKLSSVISKLPDPEPVETQDEQQEVFEEIQISEEMLEMLMDQAQAKSKEPKWNVSIPELPDTEAASIKFTVLTSGEADCGQAVIDFIVQPGLNSNLQKWLTNPEERNVNIDVLNGEGKQIDSIKFCGRPVAMAIADLGDPESEGKPWITTFQLSVTKMTFAD